MPRPTRACRPLRQTWAPAAGPVPDGDPRMRRMSHDAWPLCGDRAAMTVISPEHHQRDSLRAEREMLVAARPHDAPRRDEVVDAFMPLIGSVAHRYRGARAVDRSEL